MNAIKKHEYFINRELSWLEFNSRVLEEAQNPETPLLERAKFLSIVSSNLDEFFMVRVAGLREQAFSDGAPQDLNSDGLNSISQLRLIARRTRELVARQYRCFAEEVQPALSAEGIRIISYDEVSGSRALNEWFSGVVFPVITPLAVDPSHPRPRYHNRGLYLGAKLRRRKGIGPKQLFAVVQLPQVLPRFVPVTDQPGSTFVRLEDLVSAKLPELFGGFDVEQHCSFRITRDSDIDLLDQESDDMLRMIEERLRQRRQADAVRLEISEGAGDELYDTIRKHEQIRDGSTANSYGYSEVYRIPGPIDLTCLMGIANLPEYDHLRNVSFTPRVAGGLRREHEDVFDAISRRDILLHHPFEDFAPVVEFIQKAAEDPDVLAIKQTLYRTSGDSPIVQALMKAAEAGKHVTAMVELKARFDEKANVDWARQMERSGVHVVHGFLDLKTHSKIALVARKEGDGVKRYVHLSTGNYNPQTAGLYTDIGLFTCDDDIAADASALFNMLTGYSQGHEWRKLTIAPEHLHSRTIELIEEQTARARKKKPAKIVVKLNALVDQRVIEALYTASQAGVVIELIIRGICCLRPGIKGVSENIRVISVVDRLLEHSRILAFGEGENAKVFLSSADWMPRNFYRRVEVMFPIESPALRKRILKDILPCYMKDNVRARELQEDGTYQNLKPAAGEEPYRCQHDLLGLPAFPDRPVIHREEGEAVPSDGTPAKSEVEPQSKPTVRNGRGNTKGKKRAKAK